MRINLIYRCTFSLLRKLALKAMLNVTSIDIHHIRMQATQFLTQTSRKILYIGLNLFHFDIYSCISNYSFLFPADLDSQFSLFSNANDINALSVPVYLTPLSSPDGWSEEGCHIVRSKSSSVQTECSCNHMTHFAVLFDYGGNLEVRVRFNI